MSDDFMSGTDSHEPSESASSAVAAPPAPPVPPAPAQAPAAFPHGRGQAGRGWRAGGIVFGSLLVAIGLLALFGGFTSIFDVLRFWPLLIVFGGLAHMFGTRHEVPVKRIAEGLGSVAVGVVLLGNTLGYIRWTVWVSLLSLWPLLVIAIGIELVGRGLHMDWLRALSNVLLIVGLLYGVLVLQYLPGQAVFPFGAFSGPAVTFAQAKPHDGNVTTGHASVRLGATGLDVSGGDVLASITGQAPVADTPTLETAVTGTTADVTVSEPGGRTVFIGAGSGTVDMALDRDVKWTEVRFDVGAVSATADLTDLQVERVVINAGASDVRLKVGSLLRNVDVQVSGGAMSLTIRVPANAACTVHSSSGLTEVRVPRSFRRTSGIPVVGDSTFVADGSGGPTITVSVASGVSDIQIETY